jgi:oligopeptidase B
MKKLLSKLSIALVALLAFACGQGEQKSENQVVTTTLKMQSDYPTPPTVAVKPQEFSEHGYKRTDNYFWLKEKNNPEVIKYLEAENAYADTVMSTTKDLQKQLYEEMKGRIKEDDQSVPFFENGYYYFSRTETGKQYRTYIRKKGDLNASEEILIDGNKMSEGQPSFVFAGYQVSTDNNILAYSNNFTGSYADFDLKFKDLKTNTDLPDVINKTAGNFVWANDNKTVFYTIPNASLRPYRVYQHVLGTDPKKDKLIYEEKNEQFNIGVSKSITNDFIFISIGSFTSSEVRYVSANEPNNPFKIFSPREKDVLYSVEHHKEKFFITYKDNNNKNYKVMEAPLKGHEDKKSWKDVVPHDPKVKIEGISVFEKYLGISARTNGLLEIQIMNLADKSIKKINFPEPTYSVYSLGNPEYQANTLRYVYTSLNRPSSTYDYDFTTAQSKLLKTTEIPSGFNPDNYEVKRIFAKSADGVEVPISLVHKKGIVLDGSSPTLLYSYGSYGYSTDANFDSDVYSLIDRGFVYALAHIRGGSDMGEQWYEDGKLLKKKNTFIDFIACAEHLVKEKYTSPDKLSIMGGSAGGLLMGAVVNMRPELFKVVVAYVPFVDVINTMLDTSLPLTTQEYEQWGNPNDKEAYDYMMSYSPYDNVAKKNYPNILATGGLNDSQVGYQEPTKWVAKLRAMKTDNNIILLKTNMKSGHGGATGRFDRLKEQAFEYAFILQRLGL